MDDRKAVWLVNKLLPVEALLSGSSAVGLEHLGVLADSIWENLGEQATIAKILAEVCGHSDTKGEEVLKQATEILEYTKQKHIDYASVDPIAFAEIAKDCSNSLSELLSKTKDEVNTAVGRKKALIKEREDKIADMIVQVENLLRGDK